MLRSFIELYTRVMSVYRPPSIDLVNYDQINECLNGDTRCK